MKPEPPVATLQTTRQRSPWWTLGLFPSHNVILQAEKRCPSISFDLREVTMSAEQRRTVGKLFSQDPVAFVVEGDHDVEFERGKEGPGSRYLTAAEFENIRELGTRLGTGGELKAMICNFCLHCIKLPR